MKKFEFFGKIIIILFCLLIVMIIMFIFSKIYIYKILEKTYYVYENFNKKDNWYIKNCSIQYENGVKTLETVSEVYRFENKMFSIMNTKSINSDWDMTYKKYINRDNNDSIEEMLMKNENEEIQTFRVYDDIFYSEKYMPGYALSIEEIKNDEYDFLSKLKKIYNLFRYLKIENINDNNCIVINQKIDDSSNKIWIDKDTFEIIKEESYYIYEQKESNDSFSKIENLDVIILEYKTDCVTESDVEWPDLSGKTVLIEN